MLPNRTFWYIFELELQQRIFPTYQKIFEVSFGILLIYFTRHLRRSTFRPTMRICDLIPSWSKIFKSHNKQLGILCLVGYPLSGGGSQSLICRLKQFGTKHYQADVMRLYSDVGNHSKYQPNPPALRHFCPQTQKIFFLKTSLPLYYFNQTNLRCTNKESNGNFETHKNNIGRLLFPSLVLCLTQELTNIPSRFIAPWPATCFYLVSYLSSLSYTALLIFIPTGRPTPSSSACRLK